MPGEVIDRPNPQPLASQIPSSVLDLSVKLEKISLSDADLKGLEEFRRASNYIAAGKFHTGSIVFDTGLFLFSLKLQG
jgi:xylulose-5-phosphate/fructose-6-phosphate phosphoketolase